MSKAFAFDWETMSSTEVIQTPSTLLGCATERRRQKRILIFLISTTFLSVLGKVEGFYTGPHTVAVGWGGRCCKRPRRKNLSRVLSSSSSEPLEEGDHTSQPNSPNGSSSSSGDGSKDRRRKISIKKSANSGTNSTIASTLALEVELLNRVMQLEEIVAKQSVEIKRLQQECADLTHAAEAFARVVELLRQAGLQTSETDTNLLKERAGGKDKSAKEKAEKGSASKQAMTVVESVDETTVFGKAPADVLEAADAAGAAILAGILGGKQRMLVDVRDADLATDPDSLVQFLELAILPVAAGLEGLKSKRNRLKIVFPTVSQLMHYRKTMALAAPEVVALSTLGFDPVENKDNLVVIIAPSPDDEDGLTAMNALLQVDTSAETVGRTQKIRQPVVVVNHHMVPISGPAAGFEVAYHLRLLSVQYISGDISQNISSQFPETSDKQVTNVATDDAVAGKNTTNSADKDAALEAAMKHARQSGVHTGVTRAMVVRAFPRPWHVFVDTSPNTDADFEVAATFDLEPTSEQVNVAIVECLEGSEQEDELVAKQMQQALETGQLDRIAEMLGEMGLDLFDDEDDEDEDDDNDDHWDTFREDSV